MIAKIFIPIIIVIVLTFIYFYKTHHWRKKKWWLQLLAISFWVFVILQVVKAFRWHDYFPDTLGELMTTMYVLVVCVMMPAVVACCGMIGMLFKYRKKGETVGWILAFLSLGVFIYGMEVGSKQLEVRHVEFSSEDLPAAFDGYKLVQISDLHLGSMTGSRTELLREAVDSINAQQADAVVFTGDLQNKEPNEVLPHIDLLSRIKAKDGIFSVLGNHDYAEYIDQSDPYVVSGNLGMIRSIQEDLGWSLLNNGHRTITRDTSSIYIAGMENDGEGRFPQLGNIQYALFGLHPDDHDFVVMLEHDPTSWKRKILPHCHVQLTLSGHTHGGQFAIFGWSPASLHYKEICGMYYSGDRALHVSKGLGGVIPFRFGVKPEIVVITLRCKNANNPKD